MLRVVMQLKKGKETKRKYYVPRQHRSPPETKEHIFERSPPNEMFREKTQLKDIDFSIN